MNFRADFWDHKIETWENAKYAPSRWPLLDPNSSVKFRSEQAMAMLTPIVKDRSIIELGCGTGRLMPVLLAAGAKSYTGVDISGHALAVARQRAEKLGVAEKIKWLETDVCALAEVHVDVCFSLGVLDWLNFEEIQRSLRRVHCDHFLHSFSERRADWQQALHRLYVYLLYGRKTGSYIPRYYEAEQIAALIQSSTGKTPQLWRDRRLSFGCFCYHLET